MTKYGCEQPYEYEADSAEDAMRQAADPDGDALVLDDLFGYSHTLPAETWKTEKA